MIQKIGFDTKVKNSVNITPNKNNAAAIQYKKQDTDYAKPSAGLLHSYYISFKGGRSALSKVDEFEEEPVKTSRNAKNKMSTMENNASYYGEKLLSDSREIAQRYNHAEINQMHILKAGLESIKNYIEQLDSGEIAYEEESSFSMYGPIEDILVDTAFKEKSKRDKIKPIIEQEIKLLDKKLAEIPPAKSKVKKPEFSKDFQNDLYSLYLQDNGEDMDGDGLVHDDMIFSAALFPNNDKMKKEIMIPFRMALKDEIQMDRIPLSKRIHLSFYDDKALNIWKNLAIGTNMAVLHDKEVKPGYLINSFLHVFDKSENGFGNLTKANTEIVNFNDNGKLDIYYINSKLREFAKNKDKNYIMIMSIMDKDMESIAINGSNVEKFSKAPKNVKFVMIADKDKYYKENNDIDVKDFFGDFGEVSMPLMNMTQAKKMFKDQPELTSKLKKPFSKQAIERAVEAANQLKGNYPEKAQKVMDLIAAYYVDKEKINLDDVQNYIKEAKEIFKPVENDSSIKIVFDTGIKLKDMVGSPTTKKEAKSIVERVKDKSLGTKGFVIYSQDGSVGAGRKYTAQAIAGEAKIPYIEINAVDFGTKDVDLFGGGNLSPEASMKKLFSMVKAQAEANPSKSAVLFVENFEYFSYGEMVSGYHEKAMSQLIREMNKA